MFCQKYLANLFKRNMSYYFLICPYLSLSLKCCLEDSRTPQDRTAQEQKFLTAIVRALQGKIDSAQSIKRQLRTFQDKKAQYMTAQDK